MNPEAAPTRAPHRRLFVALWPDDATRAALSRARDRWTWSPGARRTPTVNLHATLVFVGDLPSDRVPALIDVLAVRFEPFALRFDLPATWPNGIAALEPTGDIDALHALQAAVAARTAAFGIPAEARRYRPHVTLAREARGSTPPPPDDGVAWSVADYALVESRGGRYTTVATWRL